MIGMVECMRSMAEVLVTCMIRIGWYSMLMLIRGAGVEPFNMNASMGWTKLEQFDHGQSCFVLL